MRPLSALLIWLIALFPITLEASKSEAASPPAEILIAAAASLAPYCKVMARQFEASTPGVRVSFTFASSGHLRQQIEAGAPVEGFISASTKQMDMLQSKGLTKDSTRLTLARNRLVLIAPSRGESTVTTFSDLASPGVTTIGLGDPSHVPAGYYGKETLKSLGLWEKVKPKLIYGLNVRQVLQYVAQGEVDAGIVYFSDAYSSDSGVRVAAIAPKGSHPTIIYPMAVLVDANHPEQAERFFLFLRSPLSQEALAEYGLTPVLREQPD